MKLLLHICCAPCSVACVQSLRAEGLEIRTEADAGAPERGGILKNPIVAGIVVSVSNPYWLIWPMRSHGSAKLNALTAWLIGEVAAYRAEIQAF